MLAQLSLSPELIQALAPHTLCTPNRLNNLRRLGRYMNLHGIEGDFVECGTYKGGTAAALALELAQNRHLWLYDSFEGMPETTEKDGMEAGQWVGQCVAAQADLERALAIVEAPQDRYTIRPGWFSETFQQPLPDRIALLHCDADWYDSVTIVLETLYDRIVEGGAIVFDDFGYWEGCREAVFNFCRGRGIAPLIERVGPDQAFWIKGRTHNRDLDNTWVIDYPDSKHPNHHGPLISRYSMMSKEEQEYLCNYSNQSYRREGKIVELGCWLGAGTIALAQGLVQSAQTPEPLIHSYDIFIWENSMSAFLQGRALDRPLNTNDSFLEQYLQEIKPCQDWVKVHAGDLLLETWEEGAIEFLFVDAMKSWELSGHIVRQFFTALVPGKSTVFHQDFAYFGTYWIPLIMYRLREYFKPVQDLPNSWGVAFELVETIPESKLAQYLVPNVQSLEELDGMLDYCKSFTDQKKWPQFYGAKVMGLMSIDRPDLAERTLVGHHLTATDLQMPLGIDLPRTLLQLTLPQRWRIEGELVEAREEIDRLKAQIETLTPAPRQTEGSVMRRALRKVKRMLN